MQIISWFNYLFISILVFGLSTNGVKRLTIIRIGFIGFLFLLISSVIYSVLSKELFLVTFIFESFIATIITSFVFRMIFRNVNPPPIRKVF